MKLLPKLPLPPPENPDDGGMASLPTISAVTLYFFQPDSSSSLAARFRCSAARLAAQTRPIPAKPSCEIFHLRIACAFVPSVSTRAWICCNTSDPLYHVVLFSIAIVRGLLITSIRVPTLYPQVRRYYTSRFLYDYTESRTSAAIPPFDSHKCNYLRIYLLPGAMFA